MAIHNLKNNQDSELNFMDSDTIPLDIREGAEHDKADTMLLDTREGSEYDKADTMLTGYSGRCPNMTKGNDNPSMTEGMVNSMFDSMNYGKNLAYQEPE